MHFETNRTSSLITKTSSVSQMHETLQKIANPESITNTVERQQFTQLRDNLVQQSQKGEPLATSILRAANTVTNVSKIQQQAVSQTQQILQNIANPESITNVSEKQQFTSLRNQLMQQSKQGDSYSTTITNLASNIANLSKQNNEQA